MFGQSKSKTVGRAGQRSFKAFVAVFVGDKLAQFTAPEKWEPRYHETRQWCVSTDPVTVSNRLIDGLMEALISNSAKIKERFAEDGWKLGGTLTAVGLLSQIVFAHGPAIGDAAEATSIDRVCFDLVTALSKAISSRAAEMEPAYREGAQALLQSFLAVLFEQG